jgi:tRNA (cytidine/uridine-2'-O-)-methyltransferase
VPALHVVLVEPEIPWNTGNAGRTCLAAGAQLHLVAPLGFSLDERQVRRAGLDYWPRVNPQLWPSWEAFAAALPELGTPFYFTSQSSRRFQAIAYPARSVLIFGRESVGLPRPLLEAVAPHTVVIPMLDPAVRSLNLSTSVALAVYEVQRQWGWPALASATNMVTSPTP